MKIGIGKQKQKFISYKFIYIYKFFSKPFGFLKMSFVRCKVNRILSK